MQDLIKLLFSNFYVVIIIVGFLLTVLNKARGKQNPGNSMPPFDGGQNGRPQAGPFSERPSQPKRPQHSTVPSQAAQRTGVRREEASGPIGGSMYTSQLKPSEDSASRESDRGLLARSLEAQRLAVTQQPKTGRGAPRVSSSQTSTGVSFHTPRGDDLRQAIIMAEVLGPPRSKRPLRQK